MFYVSIERDLAIAQIPKAGFQTIEDWLGPQFNLVKNHEALSVSRRVAFFRHPLERLKSCFSFMYWMRELGQEIRSGAPTEWPAFVDFILSNDDEHWRPQCLIVEDVPTIYHRFEDIGDLYERYKPGILPHNNRASRRETTNYKEADLLNFYATDLRIWTEAA